MPRVAEAQTRPERVCARSSGSAAHAREQEAGAGLLIASLPIWIRLHEQNFLDSCVREVQSANEM